MGWRRGSGVVRAMLVMAPLIVTGCKSREERASEAVTLGRSALDSADYPTAEQAFRRALQAQPGFPDALAGLSLLATRRGAPETGLDLVRQCKGVSCAQARQEAVRHLLHEKVNAGRGEAEIMKLAEIAETDPMCGLLDVLREIKAARQSDAQGVPLLVEAVRQAIEARKSSSEALDEARLVATMSIALSFAGLDSVETCDDLERVRGKLEETYATLAAPLHGSALPLVPPTERQRRDAIGILALEGAFRRATGSPFHQYIGDAGEDDDDDDDTEDAGGAGRRDAAPPQITRRTRTQTRTPSQ